DQRANAFFGRDVRGFETSRARTAQSRGVSYKYVDYKAPNDALTLFAAPPTDDDPAFAAPQYEALIAIPQDQLASAWLELVPRLVVAGAIALTVSFIVSYFISR